MKVQVLLFGRLRRYGPMAELGGPALLVVDAAPGATIDDLFLAAGVPPSEVATVFLNGRLAETAQTVADGDRLGIFGKEMGLLYV
jgi:hypothetical protein